MCDHQQGTQEEERAAYDNSALIRQPLIKAQTTQGRIRRSDDRYLLPQHYDAFWKRQDEVIKDGSSDSTIANQDDSNEEDDLYQFLLKQHQAKKFGGRSSSSMCAGLHDSSATEATYLMSESESTIHLDYTYSQSTLPMESSDAATRPRLTSRRGSHCFRRTSSSSPTTSPFGPVDERHDMPVTVPGTSTKKRVVRRRGSQCLATCSAVPVAPVHQQEMSSNTTRRPRRRGSHCFAPPSSAPQDASSFASGESSSSAEGTPAARPRCRGSTALDAVPAPNVAIATKPRPRRRGSHCMQRTPPETCQGSAPVQAETVPSSPPTRSQRRGSHCMQHASQGDTTTVQTQGVQASQASTQRRRPRRRGSHCMQQSPIVSREAEAGCTSALAPANSSPNATMASFGDSSSPNHRSGSQRLYQTGVVGDEEQAPSSDEHAHLKRKSQDDPRRRMDVPILSRQQAAKQEEEEYDMDITSDPKPRAPVRQSGTHSLVGYMPSLSSLAARNSSSCGSTSDSSSARSLLIVPNDPRLDRFPPLPDAGRGTTDKHVRFGTARVYEHDVMIGETLNEEVVCPLQLDWKSTDAPYEYPAAVYGYRSYFANCPAQKLSLQRRRERLVRLHRLQGLDEVLELEARAKFQAVLNDLEKRKQVETEWTGGCENKRPGASSPAPGLLVRRTSNEIRIDMKVLGDMMQMLRSIALEGEDDASGKLEPRTATGAGNRGRKTADYLLSIPPPQYETTLKSRDGGTLSSGRSGVSNEMQKNSASSPSMSLRSLALRFGHSQHSRTSSSW